MKLMKDNQEFQWIGEGISVEKRGNKIRYQAFSIGGLKIRTKDFILVRNDDALDPEDFMSCYVAQIKDLYDTGNEIDPYQAQVQWFSRIPELPAYAMKSLTTAGHEYEIVQDNRSSWYNMIDAETIFGKCEVIYLTPEDDCESALSDYIDHPFPVFFCRYIFSRNTLIPVTDRIKPGINDFQNSTLGFDAEVLTNGFHFNTSLQNSVTPKKSKSRENSKNAESMYCAIPIGSPTSPKVLLRRITDKILDSSKNQNIRIFVADSESRKIEDATNIVLNKLKQEKQQQCDETSKKKPIILSFSQNKLSENDCWKNCEVISNDDSDVDSDTVKTPETKIRKSFKKSATPSSLSKTRKQLFTHETRNSPRKNIASKNTDACSTPNKKAKMLPFVDDILHLSTLQKLSFDSSDEDDFAETFSNKLKFQKDNACDADLDKRPVIHSFIPHNSNGTDLKFEIDEIRNHDSKAEFETPKSRKSSARRKGATPLLPNSHINIDTASPKRLPHKNAAVENSGIYSTPTSRKSSARQKVATPLFLKSNKSIVTASPKCSPHKNATVKNSDIYSTPTSGKSSASKKVASPLFPRSHKNIVTTSSKCSPHKNAAVENPDVYSTPTKKAKFADIINDFHLTRSGRKVKSINYSEQLMALGTPEKISSAVPSKKKPPRFVRDISSDDSDSSNFSAEEDSSDDSSQSGISELDMTSPSKRKSSKKTKKKTVSKVHDGRVQKSSSKKSIINLSIPDRKTPLRTPKTPLEESRQRLHVSAVPNSLPCREEEFSDIYNFVRGCLCAQTGGCMYISGVPGTGKTATVHEVLRNLEAEKESGEVPIFTFVEVNGMWMTDPYQCYVQIFKALTGKTIAPLQASDLLQKRFTERGPKKEAVVLLVDELDRLWTRKQTVMYNIFDWPTKKNSKLVVLAIANTMDLPERMMMNRNSSRLGLTRKTFQPYTFKQLQEIIMSRIQELKVFDPDAVQLVARKVAALSGDARRALDICRFATETVKVTQTPKRGQKVLVGMEQVDQALQQIFSNPVISAIRSSSKMTKLFFQCILSEFTRSGLEETTLLKVHRQVVALCRFEGILPPNTTEMTRICCDLAASHLILVDNFRNDIYMKIRLNVSSDDVTYALTQK